MDDDALVATLGDDDAGTAEIDRIDPVPETLELSAGIQVRLMPLRTRQLFKLLRIITHGAGLALNRVDLNFGDDPDVFIQKLLTLVLFAIPDAEQEAIDFLQSVVEPVELIDKAPRDMNDKERKHNVDVWTELNKELWNPDPMDTIAIIENVVRRESADLQALGKRIAGFLELAKKTGQLKPGNSDSPASPESAESQAPSRARSTSSRTSTGGKTTSSSASPSGASGRSPRPSSSGAGKRSAASAR